MLAMMKRQAAAVSAAAGGGDSAESSGDSAENGGDSAESGGDSAESARAPPPTMSLATTAEDALGPVGTRILANLKEQFAPTRVALLDESSQHAGHAGAKGFNGESHFALAIVSEAFAGVRSLKRHQVRLAAACAVASRRRGTSLAAHAFVCARLPDGVCGCW